MAGGNEGLVVRIQFLLAVDSNVGCRRSEDVGGHWEGYDDSQDAHKWERDEEEEVEKVETRMEPNPYDCVQN